MWLRIAAIFVVLGGVVASSAVARADCGDGLLEPGEECDGHALGGATCRQLGYSGGELTCGIGCTFLTRDCTVCGDGERQDGEQCDGGDLGGRTCESLGYLRGALACDESCQLVTDDCSGDPAIVCGDGLRQGDEECDGDDLSRITCVSLGFDGGRLGCSGDCHFDDAACTWCGDGVANNAERCDGLDLGGGNCEREGYIGGTIACAADCSYDTAGCHRCGDGVRDRFEDCDGDDIGDLTCVDYGFDGGTLGCDAACVHDLTGCGNGVCGNGIFEPGEECEGDELGDATCVSLGYEGGTLSCTRACTLNLDGCEGVNELSCGNGVAERGEECDGTDLRGLTCESLGYSSGDLYCRTNCALDEFYCSTDPLADVGGGSNDAGPGPAPDVEIDVPVPYEDGFSGGAGEQDYAIPDFSLGCCRVSRGRPPVFAAVLVLGVLLGRRRTTRV